MHKFEPLVRLAPLARCACGYYRIETKDLSAMGKREAEKALCKIYTYSHDYHGKPTKTETGIKLASYMRDHGFTHCTYHG